MKVSWNEKACCHSGNCVGWLPEVFTVENDRLVIQSGNTSEQKSPQNRSRLPGQRTRAGNRLSCGPDSRFDGPGRS